MSKLIIRNTNNKKYNNIVEDDSEVKCHLMRSCESSHDIILGQGVILVIEEKWVQRGQ